MTDRPTIPHNLDAERAILGSLMLSPACWGDVDGEISAEDFYREPHRRLFALIAGVAYEKGKGPELLEVCDRITGREHEFGGVAYVSSMLHEVPATQNVRRYCELVREASVKRQLLIGMERIREAIHKNEDVVQVRDDAEALVSGLGLVVGAKGLRHIREVVAEQQVVYSERSERAMRGGVQGISCGLIDVDRKIGGLGAGNLIILAARPAMGKSALAGNIARAVAGAGGVVAVFSLEMPSGLWVDRLNASEADIDANLIRDGILATSQAGRERYGSAMDGLSTLEQLPIYIDDTGNRRISEIRSQCRRLKAEMGSVSLVVADYLQLVRSEPGGRRENREQQVATISRESKMLARELGCPVLLLAQLNREVEKRSPPIPRMSDLRESGAIEQDADVVLFVYRAHAYNAQADAGLAEIIIGKARNGTTGSVKVAWNGSRQRFSSLDVQHGEMYGGRY